MLGLNMSLKTTFKKTNVLLVVGVFFVSLSFVGHGGFGLASMVNGPLQIHQESVTGRVLQLPLRSILDQFQEQLGIAYQAPKEELEERVSIDLQGESLPQALAKILAPWDYALTIDPAGRVQEIFVVRKIPTGVPEEKAITTENDRSVAPHSSRSNKSGRAFRGESQGARMDERHGESSTVGTSDPLIQPGPPQQDERELWEAMDEAGMGRIPPAGYPEMEVTQVSDEAQKAFLQSLNLATNGSSAGTGFPGMNISPVSEEEAQEILRSFNQSIGSSMEASFP
jgi:hypothetical protein